MNVNVKTSKFPLNSILWIFAISFFSYQMFQIIWPYTSWDWDVDFLQTKQLIIHLNYYRFAFYTHIFTSLIVLACGAVLFSPFVLKRWSKLHRGAGKVYVLLLLFFSAPSGFVMGFYANGGWIAKISFLILTPLWWYFTWKGYQTVRQKNFKAHKIWMMRSYALTLSAISLRIYQLILGSFFIIDPVVQYVFVSYASWVGNLLFVEYLIYKRNKAAGTFTNWTLLFINKMKLFLFSFKSFNQKIKL